MAKLSAEEKAERKRRLDEKREARRLAKEQKEKEEEASKPTNSVEDHLPSSSDDTRTFKIGENQEENKSKISFLLELPEDALHHVMSCLPARDLGCLTLTCRYLDRMLTEARVPFIMSRLHRPQQPMSGAVGYIDMCSSQAQARYVIFYCCMAHNLLFIRLQLCCNLWILAMEFDA